MTATNGTGGGGIAAIPRLGSGIGYRSEIHDEMLGAARDGRVDFFEVIAEQFFGAERLRRLARLAECVPVVPHGVGLSIGTAAPVPGAYLDQVAAVCSVIDPPFFSDHLSMTTVPGIDIGHLAPLWFTEELLRNVAENVQIVQERLDRPLVLENITYLFDIPESDLAQHEFFTELCRTTGCGILLDLTNVYTNGRNHAFEPLEFLRRLPLDRVVQLHLAGGFWSDDVLIDSHSADVPEEVWQLFDDVRPELTSLRACLLEHDHEFPPMETLVRQVGRARAVFARSSQPGPPHRSDRVVGQPVGAAQ